MSSVYTILKSTTMESDMSVPDNLVQGRIDHDPSVPGGQLGGRQDVGALDDVRRWQRDGLLDQIPTEGLPLGIPL
jgi:hypothetical protein